MSSTLTTAQVSKIRQIDMYTQAFVQCKFIRKDYADDSIWSLELARMRSLGRLSLASCIFILAL